MRNRIVSDGICLRKCTVYMVKGCAFVDPMICKLTLRFECGDILFIIYFYLFVYLFVFTVSSRNDTNVCFKKTKRNANDDKLTCNWEVTQFRRVFIFVNRIKSRCIDRGHHEITLSCFRLSTENCVDTGSPWSFGVFFYRTLVCAEQYVSEKSYNMRTWFTCQFVLGRIKTQNWAEGQPK